MYEVTPLGVSLVIIAAMFCAFGVFAAFWFVAEAIVSAYKGGQR